MIFKAEVLWGSNNLYQIADINTQREFRATLKGKLLKSTFKEYNPLSPGDIVEAELLENFNVRILNRLERKNVLWRFNKKNSSRQSIAANFEQVFIVNSLSYPVFKNKFLDRALVLAEDQQVTPILIFNKSDDINLIPATRDFIKIYEKLNIKILKTSVITGEGIDEIKSLIQDKTSVFLGQSGVGKSSIINLLGFPIQLRTNTISSKFLKGRHTTVYSLSLKKHKTTVIDTPGVKELGLETLDPQRLSFCFIEFREFLGSCKFKSCLHFKEASCNVLKQVGKSISPLRYESYVKILKELEEYKNYEKRLPRKDRILESC